MTFAIVLALVSSCKKDFGFDSNLNNQEDIESTIPEFYVRGIAKDLYNDFEFMVDLDSFYTKLFSESYTGDAPDTNTKFAFSTTGSGYPNFTTHWLEEGISRYLANGSIAIQIITNIPSGDEIALTKDQLLEFLIEDTLLPFGNQIGEIEVGINHPNIDGMPAFSEIGYRSLTSLFEGKDEMNTFNILTVEDYVQPGVTDPEKGLIVTARINCFLGSTYTEERYLELKDLEANFFFAYTE